MNPKNANSKAGEKNITPVEAVIIPENFAELIAQQSSYLFRLTQKFPDFYQRITQECSFQIFAELIEEIKAFDVRKEKKSDLMAFLRIKKAQISLLIAAADISNLWTLKQVTQALSDFADLAVIKTTEFLLHENFRDKMLASEAIEKSGLLMIAVGKLGGRELNYSSDIDLIILYDPNRTEYTGKNNVRQFFVRLCNDFVSILQERTADGYVFRVDLRLRPDPYSTPVAVSVQAACTYYENVGQNWERAAMIKARLICGDEQSGAEYMKFMESFVWRKYLDFAALNDIHSIKRQIDSNTNYHPESLLGYNIKLGKGGIREIEFFAQVQQLIWGGRMPELRQRATCDALAKLEEVGRIKKGSTAELAEIYEFYRKIEHRLQMVADEHTHSLPSTQEGMAKFAEFLGFHDSTAFEERLNRSVSTVQAYYAQLFTDSPSLSAEGNLVFTGVSNDPETLITLAKLGFKDAEKVCEIIRGWHHGRRRATRFKKVRELMTELIPDILKYFSKTGDPDVAFVKFDAFLATLPSGVQLFTLFNEKPELIEFVADLMGDSPWLAENFSRSPALVNRILSSDFYSPFLPREELEQDLKNATDKVSDYDSIIKIIRRWKQDMEFQIGIRLLKKNVKFRAAGEHFSNVADITIEAVLKQVQQSFDEQINGEFSIVAMGKLGARELTFGSDIDLVFVYESEHPQAQQYYIKLAQKFTGVMSNLSSDGVLYKVDTRLRPQGEQGNMACSFAVFEKYYQGKAWNWELLALTKARAINRNKSLSQKLNEEIKSIIMSERDLNILRHDIYDMREKIAASFDSKDPWDLKYASGGLFEMDFIIQYLILAYARECTALYETKSDEFWRTVATNTSLGTKRAQELAEAFVFFKKMEGVIRLTTKSGFSPDKVTENQKGIILEFFREEKFENVEKKLFSIQNVVNENFKHMFKA